MKNATMPLASEPFREDPQELALRRRARRQVARKMGFLIHLAVFMAVNLGLILLRTARGDSPVVLWPMAGWGLGLAIHGLVTLLGTQGGQWRERWIEREVQKLKGRQAD